MTTIDPFSTFDPTKYQTVSNLRLQTMVSLAKALGTLRPEDAPKHVDKLGDRMNEVAVEAEQAMIIRLREDNQFSGTADLELDNVVDPLWSVMSRRLGNWSIYLRPGLDFLTQGDEPKSPVDIDALRDKANRAGRLSTHLFGQGGLAFVQRPFPEQAQLMANILGLIDADGLEDELLELTGPELLPMLRRCQARYEAMVQARASRRSGSAADLRVLRTRLRKIITRYAGAVMTMLDEDEPETLGVVETALEPMVNLRVVTRASGAGDEVGEGESESEIETEVAIEAVVEDAG